MAERIKASSEGVSKETTNDAKLETSSASTPAKPKDGIFKRVMAKLELDPITIILMLKGSLPPTIIFAMYQSDKVSNIMGTLGYLSAIISILAMAMQPRARYLQNLIANCISAGLGAAVAMLVIYAAVKARESSTPARPPTTGAVPAGSQSLAQVPYNSSASAVAAVFLFFSIYLINVLKDKFPQLMISTILFSIVLIVSCTNAVLIPTVSAGYTFLSSLLKGIYIGLGVATGVSLFFVPVASRTVIKKEFAGLLTTIQTCLNAHRTLIRSLENPEAFEKILTSDAVIPEVKTVRAAVQGAIELHAKMQIDLPFAKREVGFGKIGPDEMKSINKMSRMVMLPVVGLASIVDVMDHLSAARGWKGTTVEHLTEEQQQERQRAIDNWTTNFQLVHDSVDDIVNVMNDGIDHVLYLLQFKKKPKTSKSDTADVENGAEDTSPGSVGFAAYLDRKSTTFYQTKHLTLIEWGKARGVQFSADFFEHPDTAQLILSDEIQHEHLAQKQQNQRQLYLLLYMEFLLYSASRNLLDLIIWVDKLVECGVMKRNRVIVPSFKRISKLFTSLLSREDVANDDATLNDVATPSHRIYLGSSYHRRKDPEHLPPSNKWEKFGEKVRMVSTFFQSPSSQFGFRVAMATTSIALIMFLRQTQKFTYEYRLFWSIIMTAISMSPTSGQALFGFILRAGGTFAAMLASWIIYYVAGNGKVPGIIVLYWVFVACGLWIPLKRPILAPVGIITVVTITLTIGYELEAKKLGSVALAASGQKYLGILVFGPVRLATVLAGLFVAFIWTVFPYPISEHASLRRDTAQSLYVLANYYSIIHETVSSRLRRVEGDLADKDAPGNQLERARIKAFNKEMLMISNMKKYSQFTKWDVAIGGKFPKKEYDTIITAIESITRYMSLIGYASAAYREEDLPDHTMWSGHFRELMSEIRPTSHEIVMLLSLLSGAMREGKPLPPYMPRPAPYALSERLEAMDSNILSIRHVNEPGYAAFAVMQLAARCISVDVETLLKSVKELVGELDFSISMVPSNVSSSTDVADEKDIKRKGE